MTEINTNDVQQKIIALFSSQTLGVLSTCGKKGPYANLISFSAADDLTGILFATPRKTQKYANMQTDNRVAFLVENSRNSQEDLTNAMAVTATGRVDEVLDKKRMDWMDIYLGKHPNLEDFVKSRDTALMLIRVKRYVLVEKFQSVMRIRMP